MFSQTFKMKLKYHCECFGKIKKKFNSFISVNKVFNNEFTENKMGANINIYVYICRYDKISGFHEFLKTEPDLSLSLSFLTWYIKLGVIKKALRPERIRKYNHSRFCS